MNENEQRKYWQIFNDFWQVFKEFSSMDNTEEYFWILLREKLLACSEKYNTVPLAVNMAVGIMSEMDFAYKKEKNNGM